MGIRCINKVFLSGNLSRNVETKQTPNGTMVCNFGIAVNESRKNAQGQWEEVPNFFDCVVFGKYAESISMLLTTGTRVALEGRLKFQQWEKDGQKRSRVEVIVDSIEILRSTNQQQKQGQVQGMPYQDNPAKQAPAPQQQGQVQTPNAVNQTPAPAPVQQQTTYANNEIPF